MQGVCLWQALLGLQKKLNPSFFCFSSFIQASILGRPQLLLLLLLFYILPPPPPCENDAPVRTIVGACFSNFWNLESWNLLVPFCHCP